MGTKQWWRREDVIWQAATSRVQQGYTHACHSWSKYHVHVIFILFVGNICS